MTDTEFAGLVEIQADAQRQVEALKADVTYWRKRCDAAEANQIPALPEAVLGYQWASVPWADLEDGQTVDVMFCAESVRDEKGAYLEIEIEDIRINGAGIGGLWLALPKAHQRSLYDAIERHVEQSLKEAA